MVCPFHFIHRVGFKVRILDFCPTFSSATRFDWISVTVVSVSNVSPIVTV